MQRYDRRLPGPPDSRRVRAPRERPEPVDLRGVEVDLVVTRHEAVMEYLESLGMKSRHGSVRFARREDVEGRFVAGSLPYPLAAACTKVLRLDMRIPREWRGTELSVEDVRSLAPEIGIYRVERVPAREALPAPEPEPPRLRAAPAPACSGGRTRHRWLDPKVAGEGLRDQTCPYCETVRRTDTLTSTIVGYIAGPEVRS